MSRTTPTRSTDDRLHALEACSTLAEVRRTLALPLSDAEKLGRIASAIAVDRGQLRPRVRRVIEQAAITHGVTLEEVFNLKNRHEGVVWARWLGWHALYIELRMSYPEIAAVFHTNHSSVITGVKKLHAAKLASTQPHPRSTP